MNNHRLCNEMNPFSGEHAERNSAHAFQLRGKHMFQSVPRRRSVGSGPLFFRWIVGAVAGFAFLGFIGFQVVRAISPPSLSLATPTDGLVTATPQVTVTGTTEPEVAVEINGQQVFSKPDGTFAQAVELQSGKNEIIVRATKKHGLFTTRSRTIMLKMPEGEASPVSLSDQILAHPLN